MKLLPLLISLCVAACAMAPQDRTITFRLTNVGTEPLRCKIIFGHWVERDLGDVAPGAALDIAARQAATDRALYINRYDNKRRMMIENIVCGRATNWRDTLGQIDLTKARQKVIRHLEATCAAPQEAGRVTCHVTGIGI